MKRLILPRRWTVWRRYYPIRTVRPRCMWMRSWDNDPGLTLTQALAQAKGEIIDELNNGPEVVVYNGHASTGQLSNQNLFKHSDVSQVTSSGAEIWVPLSCYVTYYESTTVNTLAHQLLFTGNAVTITVRCCYRTRVRTSRWVKPSWIGL